MGGDALLYRIIEDFFKSHKFFNIWKISTTFALECRPRQADEAGLLGTERHGNALACINHRSQLFSTLRSGSTMISIAGGEI
jgi:hypothetical protein